MRFRLVKMPKSVTWMTLNDENVTLAEIKFYGAQHKNLNEDRPILSE